MTGKFLIVEWPRQREAGCQSSFRLPSPWKKSRNQKKDFSPDHPDSQIENFDTDVCRHGFFSNIPQKRGRKQARRVLSALTIKGPLPGRLFHGQMKSEI
jgi:hypothetical protein